MAGAVDVRVLTTLHVERPDAATAVGDVYYFLTERYNFPYECVHIHTMWESRWVRQASDGLRSLLLLVLDLELDH